MPQVLPTSRILGSSFPIDDPSHAGELGRGLARAVKASLHIAIFYNDVAARDPTQFTEPLRHEFGNRVRERGPLPLLCDPSPSGSV
jgi:hypothetical protein